jgi:ABC-type Zn uptake system ZnuABC Zn-binding protein ZnuA
MSRSTNSARLWITGCLFLIFTLAACAPQAAPTGVPAVAPAVVTTAQPAATAVPPTAAPLPPTAKPKPKIKVVATTTQVTALTMVVGGDKIDLHGILQANVDPHEYEPTADDVKAFANAQIIVINGVGLEKWLQKTIDNSGTKLTPVDTSTGVKIRTGKAADGSAEDDPHIWHAAPNAIIMLNNIRDGLIKADAVHADTYKANAAAYEKKLDDLDAYITAQIATIPFANRKVVANHDAFGYYFDRYQLTFVGSVIPSMDTNFQPSAKELADLVKAIKAQTVKAIFTESSINPQLAKQIAQEAGVIVVDGALFGDTLGPPGSGADTLDGMLKANTDLIVKNLK